MSSRESDINKIKEIMWMREMKEKGRDVAKSLIEQRHFTDRRTAERWVTACMNQSYVNTEAAKFMGFSLNPTTEGVSNV